MKRLLGVGIDIILAIVLITFCRTDIMLTGFLLLYSIVRAFFVGNILVIAVVNGIILYSILTNSIMHTIQNEQQIMTHTSITVVLLVLAAVQVFVILFRVFALEDKQSEIVFSSKHAWGRWLLFKLDALHRVVGVVLATLYPVILTLAVVIAFSGLYSSANAYYMHEGSESVLGLVYADSQELLPPIRIGGPVMAGDELRALEQNDFLYFSTVTYFTIGYGDIVPEGSVIKTMIILESIIAHILNISIFALFGTLFYEFIKKKNRI